MGAKINAYFQILSTRWQPLRQLLKFPSSDKHHKITSLEVLGVSLVVTSFLGIFMLVALHRFWQYAAWYYDFGIFFQAVAAVAHGRAPIIDHFVFTDQIIFADHFHPLFLLISPLYALFPKPEILLVVQTAAVAISGVFVYATARRLIGSRAEALALLIIYFSFVGLHNALIAEFHPITLLPLPLSIFLWSMVGKKKWVLAIATIAILLTKESTFIIPTYFGLFMAFHNRGEWRRVGIITTTVSILYGLTIILLVFPLFSEKGYYYLGGSSTNFSLWLLFEPHKLKTMMNTLLSFGGLPLLAPDALGPVLFNWWSRFSSVSTTRHNLGLHYNAEIAPTLIFASTLGWLRLKRILRLVLNNRLTPWPVLKTTTILIFTIAVGALFLSSYIFRSPGLMAFNRDFYAHSKNFVFLDELLMHLPPDGVVMAQQNLASKLAYRKVYMLRQRYQDYSPDYIVFDTRDGQEPNNFFGLYGRIEEFLARIKMDPAYELYYQGGEQYIFAKKSHLEL